MDWAFRAEVNGLEIKVNVVFGWREIGFRLAGWRLHTEKQEVFIQKIKKNFAF